MALTGPPALAGADADDATRVATPPPGLAAGSDEATRMATPPPRRIAAADEATQVAPTTGHPGAGAGGTLPGPASTLSPIASYTPDTHMRQVGR